MLCLWSGIGMGESSYAPIARPAGDFRRGLMVSFTLDCEIIARSQRETTQTRYMGGWMMHRLRKLVFSWSKCWFRDGVTFSHSSGSWRLRPGMSREAWGWSMDASDLTCTEVMALCTQTTYTVEALQRRRIRRGPDARCTGGGGRMFPEESDKIERYVGGLPDMIHGSVVHPSHKPMQEATE
ncbi:hypothetical protein Tco_0511284 [Tanacetum coccineum]